MRLSSTGGPGAPLLPYGEAEGDRSLTGDDVFAEFTEVPTFLRQNGISYFGSSFFVSTNGLVTSFGEPRPPLEPTLARTSPT